MILPSRLRDKIGDATCALDVHWNQCRPAVRVYLSALIQFRMPHHMGHIALGLRRCYSSDHVSVGMPVAFSFRS